jgi:hypothetical protein
MDRDGVKRSTGITRIGGLSARVGDRRKARRRSGFVALRRFHASALRGC